MADAVIEAGTQRAGVFHHAQKTLHRRTIIAYAVAQSEPREAVSFGILGKEFQMHIGFSLLTQQFPEKSKVQ